MLYPLSYGRLVLLFSLVLLFTSVLLFNYVAEARGFEPPVRFKTDNSLAVSPIRPLWHASRRSEGKAYTALPDEGKAGKT